MKAMSLLKRASLVLVAGSVMATAAAADVLRIGAMPVGSALYVAGVTLSKQLEPVLEGMHVEVIPRGGGIANPMVVEAGRAEIAISTVATSVWAHQGHEIYEGEQAPSIRALVGGLNAALFGAMARNDLIARVGSSDLEDILTSGEPLRIVMKPAGSLIPPTVDMILEAHGLTQEDIIANGGEIIQVDVAQIPAILRDGRADLYFDTVLRAHPVVTEISLTGDVTFIDLSEEARERLAQSGLRPATIPEWFEGQTGPTLGADYGTVIIAHEDLPEDVAYQVVKTMIETMPQMVEEYPSWAEFVAEEAWKPENTGVPLHPGAERYYRERGWM